MSEHKASEFNLSGETLHDHGRHTDELLRKKPSDEAFVKAADVFTLLNDPTRLRILWFLSHSEECVTNISIAIGMSAPAVSHHLRLLRQTGLLQNKREGKEVYYKLADTPTGRLVHKAIDDIFEINCK